MIAVHYHVSNQPTSWPLGGTGSSRSTATWSSRGLSSPIEPSGDYTQRNRRTGWAARCRPEGGRPLENFPRKWCATPLRLHPPPLLRALGDGAGHTPNDLQPPPKALRRRTTHPRAAPRWLTCALCNCYRNTSTFTSSPSSLPRTLSCCGAWLRGRRARALRCRRHHSLGRRREVTTGAPGRVIVRLPAVLAHAHASLRTHGASLGAKVALLHNL